jgi:hypothetical protein
LHSPLILAEQTHKKIFWQGAKAGLLFSGIIRYS